MASGSYQSSELMIPTSSPVARPMPLFIAAQMRRFNYTIFVASG